MALTIIWRIHKVLLFNRVSNHSALRNADLFDNRAYIYKGFGHKLAHTDDAVDVVVQGANDVLDLVALHNRIHAMDIPKFKARIGEINRAAMAVGQGMLFFHDGFGLEGLVHSTRARWAHEGSEVLYRKTRSQDCDNI